MNKTNECSPLTFDLTEQTQHDSKILTGNPWWEVKPRQIETEEQFKDFVKWLDLSGMYLWYWWFYWAL